jgi:tetratricopeptide (TPR) repeat protein
MTAFFRFTAALAFVSAIIGCAAGSAPYSGKSYIAVKGVEVKSAAMQAYSKGEYRYAREKFMEALRIDRSIGNRPSETDDLIYIGRVNILLGEPEAAKSYLYDAVRVGVDADDGKKISEAYSSLALADRLTGDYAAALDSIDESINMDRRSGAVSGARLNQKALIFIDAGRGAEAAGILRRAVEINKAERDGPEIANSDRAMAELSGLAGGYEEAIGYYREAYDIDKSGGDERKVALDLEKMGELSARSGSLKDAIALFEKSYIVRLNGNQTPEAISNLDRLIEACRSVGNEEKAGFYMKIKAGIMEKSVNRKAGPR